MRAVPVDHPPFRRLRAYAFDPSVSTELENAVVNQVTMKAPWEHNPGKNRDVLRPGPVGEYVEVIDFDPASDRFYGWKKMPFTPLMQRLAERTAGRVSWADRPFPKTRPNDLSDADWQAFKKNLEETDLYMQFTVADG